MTIESIKSVAVIGAGTMGQGIAQVCASAGFKVQLYDIQSSLITNAFTSIKKNLDVLTEKGKINSETRDTITSLIIPTSDFKKLQVELVIEAVIEKLDVKQKMFSELEKINDKNCILTSNTSSIPITQIAGSLKHADRFAGFHFFNPAPLMKLVEIIKGTATAENTIQLLKAFAIRVGKQPVFAQDSPGFIVNRVARHYYVESLKLVEESISDFEGIDKLLRSSGFKMGPFELMDLIGVDVNFSVTSSMYNAFHQDPKFRPSRIQQQKVDAGQHGRKTGKGFYDYEQKEKL